MWGSGVCLSTKIRHHSVKSKAFFSAALAKLTCTPQNFPPSLYVSVKHTITTQPAQSCHDMFPVATLISHTHTHTARSHAFSSSAGLQPQCFLFLLVTNKCLLSRLAFFFRNNPILEEISMRPHKATAPF